MSYFFDVFYSDSAKRNIKKNSDIVCIADSIILFKLMSSDPKARKSIMMLCPMITHKTSKAPIQSPQKELAVLVVCP